MTTNGIEIDVLPQRLNVKMRKGDSLPPTDVTLTLADGSDADPAGYTASVEIVGHATGTVTNITPTVAGAVVTFEITDAQSAAMEEASDIYIMLSRAGERRTVAAGLLTLT